jgi:hypothetical protein
MNAWSITVVGAVSLGIVALVGCGAEEEDGQSTSEINKKRDGGAEAGEAGSGREAGGGVEAGAEGGAEGGSLCTPDARVLCRCEDRAEGQKMCNSAGTAFSECNCISEGPMTCFPNAVVFCRCANGDEGTKMCDVLGEGFSPCACE